MTDAVGRVAELGVYPVKSLRGLSVPSARLEPWGFAGDRRWLVVDPDGRFVTQRTTPGMVLVRARWTSAGLELSADGAGSVVLRATDEPVTVTVQRDAVRAVGGDPAADRWLSDVLGRPVRLVHMDRPSSARPVDPEYAGPGASVSFADGYPVLVTTTASLAAVNAWQRDAGARVVPMDRFRPSIVVDTDVAWAEDGWAEITVGAVRVRLVKPCARCVMTGVVPATGTIEPGGPLRQIGRHRPGVAFGVNGVPALTGTVHVGDPVRVVAPAGAGA